MAITLKAARVNKNLTQEQAAKLIGVNASMVQKWESGKCSPSVKNIQRILETYGLKYEDIIFLSS